MSKRPTAIIDTEVALTQRGILACNRMVTEALAVRRDLLSDGWPASHALCEELDADAARWAAQVHHQQQALVALAEERDQP